MRLEEYLKKYNLGYGDVILKKENGEAVNSYVCCMLDCDVLEVNGNELTIKELEDIGYLILTKCCAWSSTGHSVVGAVQEKESAIILCNRWDSWENEEGLYYFIEIDRSHPAYMRNPKLDYLVEFE